jgi:hypothetical protein
MRAVSLSVSGCLGRQSSAFQIRDPPLALLVGLPACNSCDLLACRMKRALAMITSGIIGALYCLVLVALLNALHVPRRIPLYSDDDSNLRMMCFAVFVLPSFIALGAGIGCSRNLRAFAIRWVGMAIGSVAAIVAVAVLSPSLSRVASRSAANAAAVLTLLLLPLASAMGAWLAGHRGSLQCRDRRSHR